MDYNKIFGECFGAMIALIDQGYRPVLVERTARSDRETGICDSASKQFVLVEAFVIGKKQAPGLVANEIAASRLGIAYHEAVALQRGWSRAGRSNTLTIRPKNEQVTEESSAHMSRLYDMGMALYAAMRALHEDRHAS
jgi:hypothetical protein